MWADGTDGMRWPLERFTFLYTYKKVFTGSMKAMITHPYTSYTSSFLEKLCFDRFCWEFWGSSVGKSNKNPLLDESGPASLACTDLRKLR